MISCTFFGHRDCPETMRGILQKVIKELIMDCGVEMFYVGNQGRFDALVRSVLRELKKNILRPIMLSY